MTAEMPVALLHSYLNDRGARKIPDRLTRVGILAAAEFYRHGKIEKICITAEHQLSDLQAKRLKSLLNNLPDEDIVVEAKTVTTREEINTFKKLADKNNWKNLITIGDSAHLPRIKNEIKASFKDSDKNIEAISTNDILSQFPRYTSILAEMGAWPERKSLAIQEKILKIPLLGNLLLNISPHLAHLKVSMQSWFFQQIEQLQKF